MNKKYVHVHSFHKIDVIEIKKKKKYLNGLNTDIIII